MSTSDYASAPEHQRRDQRAGAPPQRDEGELAALQHSAGNRAVSALIQAKLAVGAVDDPLEREADLVAKRVVAGSHRHEGPACADCTPAPATTGDTAIRRSGAGGSAVGGALDGATDTAIHQASGGGRPLEPDVQRSMEADFGVDFSGVNVHADAEADGLNRQLGARAFTTGSDIFFRQGEYAPDTAAGKELLAHELTHVVQQGAASAGDDGAVHRSAEPATVQRKEYAIGKTGESLEIGFFTSKKERDELLTEAETIITELKTTYGVTVSSSTTVEGIKEQYTNVTQKVRDSLRTKAWKIRELRALKRALGYYAAILGANRDNSTRKGIDQEVTSVGKVKQAIDANKPAGQLDTTTLGEYFRGKKNMGLFKASEKYVADFSSLDDQLTGTFVHEIAHGLLEYCLGDYIDATGYWETRNKELAKPKRTESPITDYGETNAAEDLCESAMMFFVEPQRLKTNCPLRYAFMVKLGTAWVPPPSEAPQVQPEAKGEVPVVVDAPKDEAPPPELEKAEKEIDKVLDTVAKQPEEAPSDGSSEEPVGSPDPQSKAPEPVGGPDSKPKAPEPLGAPN